VKVTWSRTLPTTPTSVTVIKDAAGRYFASFVIDTDPQADAARMPDTDRTIGIDLGLTHFAVLSDGTKIDFPRFLRRAEKKLKKAQRELSRKQNGSKNREKARLKAARAHATVSDARREFHHQLSTKVICENQGIAVEDLSVAGLARTRLAKSVHDAGWSSFVNMLEYKAARYGRTLVKIGRFEPTSQVCSACGVKDGPKPLNVREWTCSACGSVHDRDVNAAMNVKTAAGLAASACGAPEAKSQSMMPTGRAPRQTTFQGPKSPWRMTSPPPGAAAPVDQDSLAPGFTLPICLQSPHLRGLLGFCVPSARSRAGARHRDFVLVMEKVERSGAKGVTRPHEGR
jgi:IS605 OrfB family transposase